MPSHQGDKHRTMTLLAGGIVLTVLLFFSILFIGAADISCRDVMAVITGGNTDNAFARIIILENRLPMAICALSCGATLSISGLIMQTIFHNPLAGPSVLGISSGASLGVAFFMLSAGAGIWIADGFLTSLLTTTSALVGGLFIIAFLFVFSSILHTGASLLIVGIMISYICTSGISLLNYFSPAEEIRGYLIWGLGSFSGLRLRSALWLLGLSVVTIIPSFFYIKPLNAILLGDSYLESVGYRLKTVRGSALLMVGLMVAVATAFCGPITFIGLVTPHLCRLLFKTSNHKTLLPGSMILGSGLALLCGFIGVIPSASFGVLPINIITPAIGVPVILFLLVNRNRLPYFS